MRVLKVLLSVVLLTGVLLGANLKLKYIKELKHMSYSQKNVLMLSYVYGKEMNLGYTLAAIAWKESNCGMYMVNLKDGSNYKFKGAYGPYQSLLNSVMERRDVKYKTLWYAGQYVQKLILDFDFAAKEALRELVHWKSKYKGQKYSYSKMLASYNGGYNGFNKASSRLYAKDILLRVKILKLYNKKTNIFRGHENGRINIKIN